MTAMPADAFGDDAVPLHVPDGWKKASLGAPVPVVRCVYIFPDTHDRPGEQCKKWSLRGTTVCIKHGGRLDSVRQHAEAVVESARLRLIDRSDEAVDWLLDLGRNSTSDAVRLKAATEVLDRSGVKGGIEVDVNVTHTADPAELLRERLATLRKRTIEGEVAKRDAEQAALEAATDPTSDEPGDTLNPDDEPLS